MKRAIFAPKAIALTLITLTLIALCLNLAKWQWDRKSARDQTNMLISQNLSLPPVDASQVTQIGRAPSQELRWRHTSVTGILGQPLLLRNRYSAGVYGYGVLAPVTILGGTTTRVWVDLGWVKAGATAKDIPKVRLPTGEVRIVGHIRGGDSFDRPGPRGTLFGLAQVDYSAVAKKINNFREANDTGGYIEVESLSPSLPTNPVALPKPEISDGPHAAYATQWLAFAVMILLGRILLIRDELKNPTRSRIAFHKVRDKGHQYS